MEKRLSFSSLILFFLFANLGFLSANDILVSPSPITINQSQAFTIMINGTADTSDVYGLEYNINYDSGILNVNSVAEGTMLNSDGAVTIFNSELSSGRIHIYHIRNLTNESANPGINGTGNFLIIDFTAIGAGTSSLTISDLIWVNSTITNDSAEEVSSVTITNGSVVVNPGPDTLGPTITITSPTATTYTSQSDLALDFSVLDSSNVSSCWYNLDSGTNQSITNCEDTTFSVSGDGSHTLYFYANDSLGNLGARSVSFSVSTPVVDSGSSSSSGSSGDGGGGSSSSSGGGVIIQNTTNSTIPNNSGQASLEINNSPGNESSNQTGSEGNKGGFLSFTGGVINNVFGEGSIFRSWVFYFIIGLGGIFVAVFYIRRRYKRRFEWVSKY